MGFFHPSHVLMYFLIKKDKNEKSSGYKSPPHFSGSLPREDKASLAAPHSSLGRGSYPPWEYFLEISRIPVAESWALL